MSVVLSLEDGGASVLVQQLMEFLAGQIKICLKIAIKGMAERLRKFVLSDFKMPLY